MEFAFVVYLVSTVLPLIAAVGKIAVVLTCGIVLCLFVALPLWGDEEDNRAMVGKYFKNYLKWAIPIAFIAGLAPDKETSYTMIAAYTAQSIGQNERVQNIAGQSLSVVEAFLKKTKKELEKEATPQK